MPSYRLLPWLRFDNAPGLDSETDAVDMPSGFTPAGYGFDIDLEGRLAAGSIPTGTTRIAKQLTTIPDTAGGSLTYTWLYNRMWKIDATATNQLRYGAKHYDAYFYEQGTSRIAFDEDALAIVAFVPFGGDSLAIGKTTGSYILSGVTDPRGDDHWQKSDIMQEILLSDAAHATELDGVAYFSAAGGLFAFAANGQVTEITRPVRAAPTAFANVDLKIDYAKKRVIGNDGTKKFAYDAGRKKLYDYGTAGFKYTSPMLHAKDFSPFYVYSLRFIVQNRNAVNGRFTFSWRVEDGDYSADIPVDVQYAQGQYTAITQHLEGIAQARRFQIRITQMDATIAIRDIMAETDMHAFDELSE